MQLPKPKSLCPHFDNCVINTLVIGSKSIAKHRAHSLPLHRTLKSQTPKIHCPTGDQIMNKVGNNLFNGRDTNENFLKNKQFTRGFVCKTGILVRTNFGNLTLSACSSTLYMRKSCKNSY